MDILRAVVGYAGAALFIVGMIGFLVSIIGLLWAFIQVGRHGGAGLTLNDFRFFDRGRQPPEARPQVTSYWRWAGRAAIGFVLTALGQIAMALTGVSLPG